MKKALVILLLAFLSLQVHFAYIVQAKFVKLFASAQMNEPSAKNGFRELASGLEMDQLN